MSFSKKFGMCLCILPASLGIVVIALSQGDLGMVITGFFLLVLALILFIPGLIFLIVGIKKDRKKKFESEASLSEQGFKSYAESETFISKKMELKINKEKIKKKRRNNQNKNLQSKISISFSLSILNLTL